VPVASLFLPDRLTIAKVQLSPSRIRSYRVPLVARFRVVDAHGRPVVGALVRAIAVPFNRLSGRPEKATDGNGWATIVFDVRRTFPLRRGYLITLFVRARKPGGSVLGGISTRRLVSVRVGY
jgi:hypothetical protein